MVTFLNSYAEIFVSNLTLKLGSPFSYGQRGPCRFDSPGLIVYGLRQTRLIDSDVDFGALALLKLCRELPVEKATTMRGAFLYRPGFIAVSLGDGRCIQADMLCQKVMIDKVQGQFTRAGVLYDFLIPYGEFVKTDVVDPYGEKDASSPVSGIPSRYYASMPKFQIDIDCLSGSPVYAILSGEVQFSGWNCVKGRTGCGILIKSDIGQEYQYYGHLSKINVKNGQRVEHGEVIGYSGRSGDAPYPYLSIETWDKDKNPYFPMDFFHAAEITPGTIYGQRSKLSNNKRSFLPLAVDGIEGYRTLTEEARFLKERGYYDKSTAPYSLFRSRVLIIAWQRFLYDLGYYDGDINGVDSKELFDSELRYYESLGLYNKNKMSDQKVDLIRKRQEFLN